MNRVGAAFMTAVLFVATVGALPMTGAATAGFSAPDQPFRTAEATAATNHTNTSNETLPPGALLAGVLGVQQAEFEGAIDTRAFGLSVARAATNDSKAEVVLRSVENLTQRVRELERRKATLEEARENGTISNATYQAKLAELTVRAATARTLANMSANASDGLPEELLRSKGINVSAIQMLKTQAANLTGPEVAAIARSIAGPRIGLSIASNRSPVNVTELGRAGAGNATAGGPPNGTAVGPPNGTASGNESAGPPGNETGAGNGTSGAGNGQGGSGSGNGQDGGSQGGSGSGAGNGQGGSGGNGRSGG